MIDGDADKKRRGKSTRRYPISEIFLEATECIDEIMRLFKEMKVKAVQNEIRNDSADQYKSVFDYFYEMEKDE